MDDKTISRYARQLLLPQVGLEGQECLRRARVMIVGLGGLGSPVAQHLARVGIGHLILADHDRVTLDNLHRQFLYSENDLGRLKIEAAAATLRSIRSDLILTLYGEKLAGEPLAQAASQADLIVDASDNFPTRQAVNQVCVNQNIPLVWGNASHFEGQVSAFIPKSNSPCYRCLVARQEAPAAGCNTLGIWPMVTAIVGAIQANEAVKILLGLGPNLGGRLMLIEAESMNIIEIAIQRKPDCPVCGGGSR